MTDLPLRFLGIVSLGFKKETPQQRRMVCIPQDWTTRKRGPAQVFWGSACANVGLYVRNDERPVPPLSFVSPPNKMSACLTSPDQCLSRSLLFLSCSFILSLHWLPPLYMFPISIKQWNETNQANKSLSCQNPPLLASHFSFFVCSFKFIFLSFKDTWTRFKSINLFFKVFDDKQ